MPSHSCEDVMVDGITMARVPLGSALPMLRQETREQEGTNHTLIAAQVREQPGSFENDLSSFPTSGSQRPPNLLLRPPS